jgi:hypothetical protein
MRRGALDGRGPPPRPSGKRAVSNWAMASSQGKPKAFTASQTSFDTEDGSCPASTSHQRSHRPGIGIPRSACLGGIRPRRGRERAHSPRPGRGRAVPLSGACLEPRPRRSRASLRWPLGGCTGMTADSGAGDGAFLRRRPAGTRRRDRSCGIEGTRGDGTPPPCTHEAGLERERSAVATEPAHDPFCRPTSEVRGSRAGHPFVSDVSAPAGRDARARQWRRRDGSGHLATAPGAAAPGVGGYIHNFDRR